LKKSEKTNQIIFFLKFTKLKNRKQIQIYFQKIKKSEIKILKIKIK